MRKVLKFVTTAAIVAALCSACGNGSKKSNISANSVDSTEVVVDSVVVDSTQVVE